MPIKSFRPITPSLRFATKLVNDDITTDKPHKPLLGAKQRTGGRNSTGSRSVRHHGGGHKQKLRIIDFKRDKYGIPGTVATVEYDPNRSSRNARITYAAGGQPRRRRGGGVRSKSQLAHRTDSLCGRREALHHSAHRSHRRSVDHERSR